LNVLMGDMSLVGTRPPSLDEVAKYEPHHWKRLAVKPGITGEWQVNGRSTVKDFEDIVKLDLAYQEKWSLIYDLKIIIKTVLVVFKKQGAC
jgi:lipopolysaccharide/colanic/teichoic acid biosynthesis glycosyltransferase